MISKKIREEFEACYPMPFACGWNSMTNEYECMWPEHAGEPDTEVPILEHNDRLKVWIKSRESLVIDFDAAARALAESMDFPWEFMPEKGRARMMANARMVIEASGVKVNP